MKKPPDVERLYREGCGQGRGQDYKPLQDNYGWRSHGRTYHLRSILSDREMELFSELEHKVAALLEGIDGARDVREQVGLWPRDETIAIAARCGINHPKYRGSDVDIVISTDLVLTLPIDGHEVDFAFAVKYSKDLADKRVIEKLELERAYWAMKNVAWRIVTERDIPEDRLANELAFREHMDLASVAIDTELIPQAQHLLAEKIRAGGHRLSTIALGCDQRMGFEEGACLSLVWYLVATRRWTIDRNKPFRPWERPAISIPDA